MVCQLLLKSYSSFSENQKEKKNYKYISGFTVIVDELEYVELQLFHSYQLTLWQNFTYWMTGVFSIRN